jgi:subtilisin family serine protease
VTAGTESGAADSVCSRNSDDVREVDQQPAGVGSGRAGRSLEQARLQALMALSTGSRDVAVGLLDGPVARDHPDLAGAAIKDVAGAPSGTCGEPDSTACVHGTFVAGILVAGRRSPAPAICPDCTLLVRPIFREVSNAGSMPAATLEEVAHAIVACVDEGTRIVNLSAAAVELSSRSERRLEQSLDYAVRRGALVVAAAGNQGMVGGSAITSHPGVIPVMAYDSRARPMSQSNLGSSIGRRGLGAPGEGIESLGPKGVTLTLGGTSFAAAFVTGAAALLWSEFSSASATEIRAALLQGQRRTAVSAPLLDASAAYDTMRRTARERDAMVT